MALRLSGGIGPVRVSTGVSGGVGCLTWGLGVIALVVALAWPYMVWKSWAIEGPYLVALVALLVGLAVWMSRTVKRHREAERVRLNREFGLPDDHVPPVA